MFTALPTTVYSRCVSEPRPPATALPLFMPTPKVIGGSPRATRLMRCPCVVRKNVADDTTRTETASPATSASSFQKKRITNAEEEEGG
jgi:hypothetical protein